MKAHLRWFGVAAIAAAGWNTHSASAQYAPYRPQQPLQPTAAGYPTTAQPIVTTVAPTAAQVPAAAYRLQATPVQVAQLPAQPVPQATPIATQSYAAPAAATAPRYPQTAAQIPAYSYPPIAQAPMYPAASTPTAPATSGYTTGYTTTGYPTYPMLAQQPAAPIPPQSDATSEPTAAAPDQNIPASSEKPSADTGPAHASGDVYPSTGYQTASGYSGYGQGSCGYTGYGDACACEPEGPNHTWFGGVYILGMERDNPEVRRLTVRVDHDSATDPYYPLPNTTVLSTHETDFNYQEGVEVRFGSTFSCGSASDTGCGYGCGSGCGCAPADQYAWEVGWWALDEDSQRATYADQDWSDNVRCYGMVDFSGLEIDRDGDGTWTPVNDYYGYGLPIDAPVAPVDGDIIVLAQQVRQYFSCQNLELNLIHFPLCGVGCGGCGGGSSCGCGSACGYPGCGTDACGCEPACTPAYFSMWGLCGLRYFRGDDDFYYCTEFGEWSGGAYDQDAYDGFSGNSTNELFYDIQVDNNLVGPQVGWNANYCVGCKWNFFCNTTFGVFNNHIEHTQRLWAGGDGGNARIIQSGRSYVINSDKDDLSFLGELRLGGSYDVTCNWRAVLAYRAIAITGIANSVDQIPTDFTDMAYGGLIDSDSSLVVHGLQLGAECRY